MKEVSIGLRLLAQPIPGLMSAAWDAATALPGLLTKKPPRVSQGPFKRNWNLVLSLDDDESFLVFLDFLFGYHWYWTRQMYVSPNC